MAELVDGSGRVRFEGSIVGAGGAGVQVTAVELAIADVPVVASSAPGDGLVLYTPAIGELLAWELCGISIAPGDEFDGDYSLDLYIEGQQGVGALGGAEPGDVNQIADPSVSQVAGLWQLAGHFGPNSGNPPTGRLLNTRYVFGTVDPVVILLENGSTPPAVGRFTVILATIPPA